MSAQDIDARLIKSLRDALKERETLEVENKEAIIKELILCIRELIAMFKNEKLHLSDIRQPYAIAHAVGLLCKYHHETFATRAVSDEEAMERKS